MTSERHTKNKKNNNNNNIYVPKTGASSRSKNSVNYVYKIFLKVFDAKWIPNFEIPHTTLPPLDTNLEST